MQSSDNAIDSEQEALTHYIDCLLEVDRVDAVLKKLSQPTNAVTTEAPEMVDGISAVVFHAGGLKFAVKVECLAGIQRLADELIDMKSAPNWVLGKLGVGKRATVVVDPARLAEPNCDLPKPGFSELLGKHLVTVNQGRMAFLCDEVERASTLDASKVKWNKRAAQRPWLSGAIMAEALAILDTQRIEELLRTT